MNTARIYVDNKPYDVKPGQHLLEACLSLGLDLPYFCWHPALDSVGACRQCAVKQFKDAEDQHGKLVVACMTPAEDGTRISIEDPEAREFRSSVIEWLMVNHPHDCPVCDEGGECHLQDMTVMTGHAYRKFRFKKRTHRNQYLGPFINHEMNRCIQCYRCVRFYRDYAGGRDFDVFGAHDHVYFGRQQDGVLENEFSGNLVEICPTGVFTDKTLKRHYTRKWDLQTAPSVCVHCALGCNTLPGERYGELRRIRNRYHGAVNGYFICDRGRYGYEFVNSDGRIRQPLVRESRQTSFVTLAKEEAIRRVKEWIGDSRKTIGIGSPRASLEANFALRTLVGPEQFFTGLAATDQRLIETAVNILRSGPARTPSLREVEQCDAVLVLGEDVINTAPRLALGLRQSIRRQPEKFAEKVKVPLWNDAGVREATLGRKGPLFIAATHATHLDDAATETFHGAPEDLARLGFAVAHELNANAPRPEGLSEDMQTFAGTVAAAFKEAERPLVVSGTGCGSESVLQAAANVAWALCRDDRAADLFLTLPECNSAGLGLMGGHDLEAAAQAVERDEVETVVVLENDLFRRLDAASVTSLFEGVRHVIAIDQLENATTRKADLVLPAATFAEASGTLVNNEGRAQRFYQVFAPAGDVQASWRWLREVLAAEDRAAAGDWKNLDAIDAALASAMPLFQAIPEIAPSADYRYHGMKFPRQPHRYSGRTSMHANVSVHEPKPPEDVDSPLAHSMEGSEQQPPSPLIPRFWSPGWNSVQALNKFQSEIGGPLVGGDPGRRLIEPGNGKPVRYFNDLPQPFSARREEWLAIAAHHIFGSEELSRLSEGIAERSPEPYVGLSEPDARRLGVGQGGQIACMLHGETRQLAVRILPGLPDGLAAIPRGLPGLEYVALPSWIQLGGES